MKQSTVAEPQERKDDLFLQIQQANTAAQKLEQDAQRAAELQRMIEAQRRFFATAETLSYDTRKDALERLQRCIKKREKAIAAALRQDLNKSSEEAYLCEIGLALSELRYIKKHLKGWMRPRRAVTPLAQFPAKSFQVMEPYGVVLIMSPWNYPFLLTMEPLIGAIAAGNCCVLKPSAYAPATAAILAELVAECFPPEWVTVVQGGRAENDALLDQTFDYIFFTGGVKVGKEVMGRAAKHLTPVTLELGGKSPVIIDATAKLELAAKRIVFGKYLNSGQTCVAPDYVLIQKERKEDFLRFVQKEIEVQYGKDPLRNPKYVHMINEKHFRRVMGLIDPEKVRIGGTGDAASGCIAPTVMDNVTPEDAVMQEEIFGPVLPILTFERLEDAIQFVNSRPHPLACYLFSEDQAVQQEVLKRIPFGGGCINDTMMHLASAALPFGGVGHSGMGSYHGKKSFETFSHAKSVLSTSTKVNVPVRYAPYGPLRTLLARLFLR